MKTWKDFDKAEQDDKLADLLAIIFAVFFVIMALLLAPNL